MPCFENSANPDQLASSQLIWMYTVFIHTMKTERKDWQKSFYAVLPPRKGVVLKVIEGSNDQTKEKGGSCDTDKITDSASKLEDADKELPVDKSDSETDRQPREIDGDMSASGQQTDKLDSSVTMMETYQQVINRQTN